VLKIFIAFRYLFSRKIVIFAVLSIALAVTAILVISCVMTGFLNEMRLVIKGFTSDIVIYGVNFRPFADYDVLSEHIKGEVPEIEHITPRVQGFGILVTRSEGKAYQKFCTFYGIIPEKETLTTNFRKYLANPGRTLAPSRFDDNWLIGGDKILDAPRIPLGDTVTLAASKSFGKFRHERFRATDYFYSGMYEYDNTTVFIPLSAAQSLKDCPNMVNMLSIKLKKGSDLGPARAKIADLLPFRQFAVYTWEDLKANVLADATLQRNTLLVILSILLLISSFSISAILIMSVLQKYKDIGILRGIGCRRSDIARIYLLYGLGIGAVGSLAGSALSLIILNKLDAIERILSRLFGYRLWNQEYYKFASIPRDIVPGIFFLVIALALGVSIIASIYPAYRAAGLDPIKAIRYE